MSMFGANPMMMAALQAAMQGRMPGVLTEQGMDPRALAQSVGAPAPGPVGGQDGPVFPGGASGNARGITGGLPSAPAMVGGGEGQSGMFANGPRLNGMQGIREALADNAMKAPAKPYKGMFPGKDWKYVVGQILPAALEGYLAASGNPMGTAMLQHRNRMKEAQQEAEMRARLPQQVGTSLVRQNAAGGFDTLYTAPTDAERYAQNIGVAPGTPEWIEAIREYRAPAWNPLAMEGKANLEGLRFGYRGALQEDRQQFSAGQQEDRQRHAVGMQEDRQSHTPKPKPAPAPKPPQSEGALYADIMRRYTKGGQQAINPIEKEFVRSYEARHKSKGGKGRSPARAAATQEAVARGPDGREYVVRNGQWVPR